MLPDKLMIVAHPDDESIFGGCALLSESGWKVICVTNRSHPIRSLEFIRAMNFVGAVYEIWDYPDQYNIGFDKLLLKDDIQTILSEREYLKIVTHNLEGEYGHRQHIVLSELMHELVKSNLYVFGEGNQMRNFPLLQRKIKLLEHYPSQRAILQKLSRYIQYEDIRKSQE